MTELPLQPTAPTSGSLLAAVLDLAEDAIFSVDRDGKIASWNRGAERLFGYGASEIVGRSSRVLQPPDWGEETAMIPAEIRRGERIEFRDAVFRVKSGDLVEVCVRAAPLWDADRRVVGAAWIARDLRPARRADAQFQLTLASIGDAVMAADERGRVTFMNPVAETLTGWRAAAAIGEPLDEIFRIINEETREAIESPVAKVLREGGIIGLSNHALLVAKDGTEHAIDDTAAPVRTRTGMLAGVVLVFRDISERRAAELTAHRLAAIVEGSHDAIIGKNLSGIVMSWNSAAERIFGYTAAEMIGRSITVLFPPDRLDEEQRIIEKIKRGERADHFETRRVRRDGSLVEVSLSISPIRDREGRIIGASKIARDIGSQKTAERALRDAQGELASRAAHLEETVRARTAELQRMANEAEAFAYSLSHDIRTPLRSITGFADILLGEFGPKIPEGAQYLQRIVRAARRMDRLLADVLAFSKVTRQDIVPEPIKIEPLVLELIADSRELQPHATAITIANPLEPVIGNAASLTQCLSNLLENAVKFVAPGVRPEVKIFTVERGSMVRLCVQDNGIGISPEGRQRLFRIFQRLHSDKQYEGTGLGLAIVLRAAERMGGTAGVDSVPGSGSTFWVELPRADGMAPPGTIPAGGRAM